MSNTTDTTVIPCTVNSLLGELFALSVRVHSDGSINLEQSGLGPYSHVDMIALDQDQAKQLRKLLKRIEKGEDE